MPTPPRTPDDGRPSPDACARLAGDLHDQLATSRLAWEAALLRSDAAIASGDRTEVAAAIEDQRLLLACLQDRVGSLLADADRAPEPVAAPLVPGVAARPAADRPPSGDPATPAARAADRAGAEDPTTRQHLSAWRRGAASLLGAAAAVALVAGATLGALPHLGDGSTGAGAERAGAAGSEGVELQVAADEVAPLVRFVAPDVVGPLRELARFSGSVPATATAAPPGSGADGGPTDPVAGDPELDADARQVDEPPREGPGRAVEPTADGVAAAAPGEDVGTDPSAADELLPPAVEELGARLTDREPDGAEVTAAIPQPLVELGERIRRSLRADPASEPGTALR